MESLRQLIETCKNSGVREIELDIEDSEMAEVQSSLGNLIPVRLELGPIKIGRTRKRTVILRF